MTPFLCITKKKTTLENKTILNFFFYKNVKATSQGSMVEMGSIRK